MAEPRLALRVSDTHVAEAAARLLQARHRFVAPEEADVVIVLGGDGFLLQCLHEGLDAGRLRPVFGMNRGTVGFLMNEFAEDGLIERLATARAFHLHPLTMTATTVTGETVTTPAINEVSLLRETRQTAKIEIAIDGQVRMPELICDGVLVSTPAGSTAYNLSAHGPILPLQSDLLALTPISPFRPRRWTGALLPDASAIGFKVLEARKRPVSAVADQREVRDVAEVRVATDKSVTLELLFDPGSALDDRVIVEQFAV